MRPERFLALLYPESLTALAVAVVVLNLAVQVLRLIALFLRCVKQRLRLALHAGYAERKSAVAFPGNRRGHGGQRRLFALFPWKLCLSLWLEQLHDAYEQRLPCLCLPALQTRRCDAPLALTGEVAARDEVVRRKVGSAELV